MLALPRYRPGAVARPSSPPRRRHAGAPGEKAAAYVALGAAALLGAAACSPPTAAAPRGAPRVPQDPRASRRPPPAAVRDVAPALRQVYAAALDEAPADRLRPLLAPEGLRAIGCDGTVVTLDQWSVDDLESWMVYDELLGWVWAHTPVPPALTLSPTGPLRITAPSATALAAELTNPPADLTLLVRGRFTYVARSGHVEPWKSCGGRDESVAVAVRLAPGGPRVVAASLHPRHVELAGGQPERSCACKHWPRGAN